MAKSATHQSSSKRKKMEHFLDKDTSVDRISNLPDSLLCHILSFLPTNEAVVTTILSSRWKPLWTLIPKLDLEDNSISDHTVYSVLAQHAAPVLQNFTLSWRSPCRTSHLNKWIHTAMSRNVQQLDLQIECGRLFELPHTVFHCKTLVVLELSGEIKLDPPPSFQLPSLKILRLYEICYISHNSFSSLCSACPILEDLKVLRDDTDNVTNFKINVPTLKRLYIELVSCLTGEPPDFKVEIYAPVLEYFRFYGDSRNIVFLEKLAHLVEAHIDVHTDNDWVRVFEFYYGDRVFKLLKALNNAKFLSIFPGDKECIGFGSIYPSMFQNLVRLNFKVTRTNWHVLQSLLVVTPNLEVLVIDKDYYYKNKLCWMEPPNGPGCLSSHLTTSNFNGFEELEHEVKFIKYILKEARVLNTVTIRVSDLHSKESVLKKLSIFPRHSSTCLLTVEIGSIEENSLV